MVLFVPLLISSCGTPQLQIKDAGRLTIGSTKNVDLDGDYALLDRNAGFDRSQLTVINNNDYKRSTRKTILANYERLRSETITEAIEKVVEGTPGGIYMENLELYQIADRSSSTWDYYVVSGDVYGLEGQEEQIRRFIVGSKAFYGKHSGEVVTLIDDQRCLWKSDKNGKYQEVLYDELTKIGK